MEHVHEGPLYADMEIAGSNHTSLYVCVVSEVDAEFIPQLYWELLSAYLHPEGRPFNKTNRIQITLPRPPPPKEIKRPSSVTMTGPRTLLLGVFPSEEDARQAGCSKAVCVWREDKVHLEINF